MTTRLPTVLGYARGDVPDYQMSAFLMAVCFQGLSGAETFALTDAMIRSGDITDLHEALGRRILVDKHSTGGVGTRRRSRSVRSSLRVAFHSRRCRVADSGTRGARSTSSSRSLASGSALDRRFVAQVKEVGIAIVGRRLTSFLQTRSSMRYGT